MNKAMAVTIVISVGLMTGTVDAGIFDDPRNLKVLPEDIEGANLRTIMIGFTEATGLRCSGCHVGEEGQPLSEFDFASDEKERKRTARAMLRMVRSINVDHLSELDVDVRVGCLTCHRGVSSPQLTRDLLTEVARTSGFDEMRDKYIALRADYYGTHSHDFSEQMLLNVANRLFSLDQGMALQVVELNLEHFPEAFESNFVMGQLLRAMNETERARDYYQRALEIRRDPRAVNALAKIGEASR